MRFILHLWYFKIHSRWFELSSQWTPSLFFFFFLFFKSFFFFVLTRLHFLKILFIYFLDRGEGREGEKHQCVAGSHAPPTEDLACNPGMCPDWVSNQQPFGSHAGTQSTEPHQPGPWTLSLKFSQAIGLCLSSLSL